MMILSFNNREDFQKKKSVEGFERPLEREIPKKGFRVILWDN